MEIKMPIKFYGKYSVIIRQGDLEERKQCQKLLITAITPAEKEQYYKDLDEKDIPTHQVIFFEAGRRRIIQGKLTVNEDDRATFQTEGKEYEFLHSKIDK